MPPTRINLDSDVLDEILRRPELDFADLLNISLTSRCWRSCAMPLIFGKQTWSPWWGNRRSFPGQTLWPQIRIFIVVGTCSSSRLLDAEKRTVLESHLQHAIHKMTAVHTIVFQDIGGGLWPKMLDIISAAPALAHLKLDESPWLGEATDVFDLPPTLPSLPLRKFEYIAPRYADYRFAVNSKRPLYALESEMYSLRSISRACRLSLESVTLPGELILLAFDLSLTWDSLRELFVEGLKPEITDISLLSVLRKLPNLRVVSLRWYGASTDSIVPKNVLALDTFLPRLQRFQVASLVPGDRVLSILPSGLETLAIIGYQRAPVYERAPNVLRASELLEALGGVHLPAVTRLELWYKIDASDEPLLRHLPRVFPHLRHLTIRRYVGRDPDMEAVWNPTQILQEVLPEFHDLQVFALEADPPERRSSRSTSLNQYVRYLVRLRGVAEESVLRTPWLREVHMYMDYYDPPRWRSHWHIWDVVAGPDQKACVRPRIAGRLMPEIRDILEGPLKELGSDSESETDEGF
ncbi:hypothetical protein B0H15DRAFT_1022985 [Mycena belliarum]|uniref:F-box domain-containing protein n=1 Tax=Mycena belliarum TaxID=1033014 RepID=A0AAD6U1K9_9AGAR|nr:hypothetical protein B0H15DRAFT_1022985 [Mycena belliae]